MSKAEVTKLDDGGYDVQTEDGRVILSADEASNKKDAEKLAQKRIKESNTTGAEES